MSTLQNKIAVITGGTTGIGFATAKRFIDEGAKVVITGRTQESLDKAVSELGANATGFRGDVSDLKSLDELFAMVKERFGKIDTLFANAGIAKFQPLAEIDEAHFDTLFNINVKGLFFTVQKAKSLLSSGSTVILTSSVANSVGLPAAGVYSATKAAVRSLARTLASEWGPEGIRVNSLSPGPIETPLFDKMGLSKEEVDEFGAGVTERVSLKRFGQADEVAKAALFLASDESSYVVGSDFVVDGGFLQT